MISRFHAHGKWLGDARHTYLESADAVLHHTVYLCPICGATWAFRYTFREPDEPHPAGWSYRCELRPCGLPAVTPFDNIIFAADHSLLQYAIREHLTDKPQLCKRELSLRHWTFYTYDPQESIANDTATATL